MNDIKPIQTTKTIITTQGWACDKCDKTYEDEGAARNHRASHCYTQSSQTCNTHLYLFEDESNFTYWKQYGLYQHHGGCAGPWQGPGWYMIEWKGSGDFEYPSLEPAGPTLRLRLENAKYDYDQALANMETFTKLAS
jgi:hypothetical protein